MVATFQWCDSVADYARRLALTDGGPIPVLRPRDGDRQCRWQRVLDELPSAIPFWTSLSGGSEHVVTAIHPDAAPIARAYAALTGRSFAVIEDIHALRDFCSTRSVLIVGWATQFTGHVLRHVVQTLDCPWGLLVADDEAGLTFQIAKLLRRPAGVGSCCVVDTIEHRATVYSVGVEQRLGLEQVPALLRQPWDVLVVRAHGRLGHVNLETAVFCPLVDEEEHDWNRHNRFGCRTDGWCKRVPLRDRPVFRYSELRARYLLLYACTAVQMSGEMYPTRSSVALAAAEGGIICTVVADRLIRTGEWETVTAQAWAAANVALGTIVRLQNDIYERREGSRPLMLLGDPWPCETPMEEVPPALRTSQYRILTLDKTTTDASVIGTGGARSDSPFWRLTAGAVLVKSADPEALTFTNRSEACEATRRWFSEVARRSRMVRTIEARLAGAYAGVLRTVKESRERHDALIATHTALDAALGDGIEALRSAYQHGSWSAELASARAACITRMRAWDAALAVVLEHHVRNDMDVSRHFVRGTLVQRRPSRVMCDRCGDRLLCERHEGLFGERLLTSLSCPACGVRRWSTSPRGAVRIDHSVHVRPGQTIPIRIVTSHSSVLTANQTHIVGWLVDLVKRKSVRIAIRAAVHDETLIEMDVPLDLSASAHPAAVIAVKDLVLTGAVRDVVSLRDAYA